MGIRRYVESGALLLKPIAATHGAKVCRHGLTVTIDGALAARALRKDRLGRALPGWSGCWLILSDEVFLIAPARRDSFDSRYFGAISRSAIVGRAQPLWTWR
jgi:type IV secretory pathway protease TraF